MTHLLQSDQEYTSGASASRHDPTFTEKTNDFISWVYAQADGIYQPQTPNKAFHKDDF